MQNIYGKETELGNAMVYGTVREGAVFLEPADILPEFLPGDIFRLPAQNRLQIIQIRTDVSGIRFFRMVSKTAKGDHLPVNF